MSQSLVYVTLLGYFLQCWHQRIFCYNYMIYYCMMFINFSYLCVDYMLLEGTLLYVSLSPQHNAKHIVGSKNHSWFNYSSIFTRCLQCVRNCTRLWDTKDINQNSRSSFPREEVNKLNSTCRKIWKHNNRGIKQVLSRSFYSNIERTSELTNHFLSSIFTVTTGY